MDLVSLDLPAWKKIIGGVCAVFLAILFFVSGAWKLSDPYFWSQFLVELRFPSALALPGALAVGIGETLGAVLILVPRFRRWGAWLIGLLLVVFMVYRPRKVVSVLEGIEAEAKASAISASPIPRACASPRTTSGTRTRSSSPRRRSTRA